MIRSCLLATSLVLGLSAVANAVDDSLVTVQGTGVVYSKPDCLHVNVSIVGESPTASESFKLNKAITAKVFEAITANKIADSDVSSVSFDFYRSDRPGDMNKPAVYFVTHHLMVKVKDLKGSGKFIDDVVAAGAHLNGIQYAVSNKTELTVKARSLAIADAKAKAEQMATALGYKLDCVKSVSEGSGNYYRASSYARADSAPGGEGAAIQLAAGEQAISVNVNVSWSLVPVGVRPASPPHKKP